MRRATDHGHADVVHAVHQDLDIVLRCAKSSLDEEVANAANRLIGSREQGLLQITAATTLVLGD